MNSENLIDDKSLRDKLSSRIDVLDKTKNILVGIPTTTGFTIQQVADFYEVTTNAIRLIATKHKKELYEDGMRTVNSSKIKDTLRNVNSTLRIENVANGSFSVDGVKINAGRNLIFTRRSILRIGMLLRDSEIAKEIRTQLLNIEEKVEEPVKVQDINEEQKLALELGQALISGSFEKLRDASLHYNAFTNRHIQQLEETNQSLDTENKILAEEVLTWADRDKLNKGIRTLSLTTKIHYGKMYNELYRELSYKHHINLKNRGDKTPYIQYIKESEWKQVMSTFTAMCRKYGTTVEKMIKEPPNIKICTNP